MNPLLVSIALFAVWLAFLAVERLRLHEHRNAVPLRIAVTGTRGKTTVTRMLAAVLSAHGKSVLAKTTGSEAAYLFPDGSIHEIHRLGAPSIIEQKRLLGRGAKMGVDVVLAEVMSVHPEIHQVEVQQILQPHLVVVTNFRADHVEAQGQTREDVGAVLALDVPPGARAFVPEEEMEEAFSRLVTASGGEVVPVPPRSDAPPDECGDFGPNLDLVWAVARALGVSDGVIQEGLCNVQDDLGALKSWRYTHGEGSSSWRLVNAFAANDPESTLDIFDRVMASEGMAPDSVVGLLSLRSDRGDRTLQWVEALEEGALWRFGKLFVAGLHAPALKYRLRHHPEARRIEILRISPPEEVLQKVLAEDGRENLEEGGDGLLFGFGNIAGLGRNLVTHWKKVGTPHGI